MTSATSSGGFGDDAVDAQRPRDDLADPHLRIERGVGILEDHLHVAAGPAHLVGALPHQIRAAEDDLAAGRSVELQDGAAGRGLAAAALADEAQRLALVDVEG